MSPMLFEKGYLELIFSNAQTVSTARLYRLGLQEALPDDANKDTIATLLQVDGSAEPPNDAPQKSTSDSVVSGEIPASLLSSKHAPRPEEFPALPASKAEKPDQSKTLPDTTGPSGGSWAEQMESSAAQ